MEWKRQKQEDGKYITAARGMHNNARFEIKASGGFITVKRWFLSVFSHYEQYPALSLTFYDLKSAKEFGEKLDTGQPVTISSINLGSGYV